MTAKLDCGATGRSARSARQRIREAASMEHAADETRAKRVRRPPATYTPPPRAAKYRIKKRKVEDAATPQQPQWKHGRTNGLDSYLLSWPSYPLGEPLLVILTHVLAVSCLDRGCFLLLLGLVAHAVWFLPNFYSQVIFKIL